MKTSLASETRLALLALCGALAWGCARPWVPVRPDALTAGGEVDYARLTLRDGSAITVSEPRLEGARIEGRVRTRCEGGRCVPPWGNFRGEISAASVASAEVQYGGAPRARIDCGFSPGYLIAAPGTGANANFLGVGTSVRFALRSGFGAVVTAGATVGGLGSDTTVVEASVYGAAIDAMALYRLRPLGHDRRGLGIDLSLGLSTAHLFWDGGHSAYSKSCGWFDWNCDATLVTEYISPPQAFTSGQRVGPALGLGLAGRYEGFVAGVDVVYRALAFTDSSVPVAAEPSVVHVISAYGYVGFGFSIY